ncbi:MAG: oligosaccharide repeat unit polymerase [Colwellia sp.]|nr:oligosaccharide repeat unit polymerase [Colwellia sp.]
MFREYFYFNFPGDPSSVYGIFFLITILRNLLYIPFKGRVSAEGLLFVNYKLLIIISVFGLLSAIFIFKAHGIPIFSDNFALARRLAVKTSQGVFWFFYMSLQVVVVLLLIDITDKKNKSTFLKLLIISWIVLLVFTLSLYGGRFFVLMPFILYVFWMVKNCKINFKFVYFLLVLGVVVSVATSMFRFYNVGVHPDELIFVSLRNDFFPEMRTFIQLTYLVHSFDLDYIVSPFISFLPSLFYELFMVDKADINLSIGMYLSGFDENSENVGYRVTVFGELYLAFGYIGVAFSYLLIAAMSYVMRSSVRSNSLLYILIVLYFSLLVPYGVTFIRSSLIMLPLSYLIISKAAVFRTHT